MGRKSVWAGVALVVVLAVVLFALARRGRDDEQAGAALPLSDRPPALTGTAYGVVFTIPCQGNCVTGIAQVRVGRAGSLHMLLDGQFTDLASNADDRVLALRDVGDGYEVVDARTGDTVTTGIGHALAMDDFPDGRIVVLAFDDDSHHRLDIIDPSVGNPRTIPLSTQLGDGVTVGPGGRIAVLHDYGYDGPGITVIEPTGSRHEIELHGTLADAPLMPLAHYKVTWSATGLFAISASHPFISTDGDPAPWEPSTLVVDQAGREVAALDGWQGLAWSPDGLGLLVGKRPGSNAQDRTFELQVRYGPELRRSVPVSTERLPIALAAWTR